MPVELYTVEDAIKIAPKAIECRIKRSTREGKAKIKLRTKRYLYTLKVEPSQVDEVVSKLGCKNVIDVDAEIARQKKERAEARKAAKKRAEEKAAQPPPAQQAPPQPQQAAAQPAQPEPEAKEKPSETKPEQGKGS
ncbi:MAG: hypothetical protein ACP5HK_00315 [Acidilobus sp.]